MRLILLLALLPVLSSFIIHKLHVYKTSRADKKCEYVHIFKCRATKMVRSINRGHLIDIVQHAIHLPKPAPKLHLSFSKKPDIGPTTRSPQPLLTSIVPRFRFECVYLSRTNST